MSVLSIHIDESGNLNLLNRQNPEYCLTMVFHNQDDDISTEISVLDEKLENIGWNESFIHTMPLIRQDEPYAAFLREERIKIFTTFAAFVSALPISYKTFFVNKTFYQNESQMEEAFVHQISSFIDDRLDYFQHFDKIVIYYDRGQKIISRILRNTFVDIFGGIVDFRTAYQKDYRLMQVADYICTLEQSRIRWDEHRPTKSERDFFLTRQIFMKNFYKKISRKHF